MTDCYDTMGRLIIAQDGSAWLRTEHEIRLIVADDVRSYGTPRSEIRNVYMRQSIVPDDFGDYS